MRGWAIDDTSVKPYTPMEKGALMADIESCLRRANDGFAMACINVMFSNSNSLKCADTFIDTGDLLGKLMDLSLTCSIGHVNTALDDQILFLTLVETDCSATNIDADVMDAFSKLSFRGGTLQPW